MSDARAAWGAAASTWDNAPPGSELITAAMVERAAVRPGERVLELACGTGAAGIAAALSAGGQADLVLSDFAPEMVEAALAAAGTAGVDRVAGRELDLEDLAEPDASYDVVLCRMGIMLVAQPGRAASEIRRVLRPDGRAVIAVWGPRANNPWLLAAFQALGELWQIELPPPDGPSPFALDSEARFEALLRDAGFGVVAVAEVAAPMEVGSEDEWWELVATGGGPLGQLVAGLPEDQRAQVRARAIKLISPHLAGGIPRSALVALAQGRTP